MDSLANAAGHEDRHLLLKSYCKGLLLEGDRKSIELAARLAPDGVQPMRQSLHHLVAIPGERRRERVLSEEEEAQYLKAASDIGDSILSAYDRSLGGIRASQRGEQPIKPEDPYLLRDASTVLLDCGLRPEECHRLRWEHVRKDTLYIPLGKTDNARREISAIRTCGGDPGDT